MLFLIAAAILLTVETSAQYLPYYSAIGYGYGYFGFPYYGSYYGLWGKRETGKQNARVNRTMCVYFKERSMLSCSGPMGIMECESVSSFEKFSPMQFESFGIEKFNEQRFNLFPRKLDNSAFMDNTCDKSEQKLSIFTDEKSTDVGVRVKDPECFRKLSELLDTSTRKETVYLEMDGKKETTQKNTAVLIGDLILFEGRARTDSTDQPKPAN